MSFLEYRDIRNKVFHPRESKSPLTDIIVTNDELQMLNYLQDIGQLVIKYRLIDVKTKDQGSQLPEDNI